MSVLSQNVKKRNQIQLIDSKNLEKANVLLKHLRKMYKKEGMGSFSDNGLKIKTEINRCCDLK